jgi:hypothetical protein
MVYSASRVLQGSHAASRCIPDSMAVLDWDHIFGQRKERARLLIVMCIPHSQARSCLEVFSSAPRGRQDTMCHQRCGVEEKGEHCVPVATLANKQLPTLGAEDSSSCQLQQIESLFARSSLQQTKVLLN